MWTLLLVDDNEPVRRTLAAVLGAEGYSVETASSFAEAREKLVAREGAYSLVVLDHHLGDGLGTDLIPLVRERSAETRVVLLSGTDDALAGTGGADGRFTKGDDFDVMIALFERLLGPGAARG